MAVNNYASRRRVDKGDADTLAGADTYADVAVGVHNGADGAHGISRSATPPDGVLANWVVPANPILLGPNNKVWIRPIDGSAVPVTAPPVVANDGEKLTLTVTHHQGAYIDTNGNVVESGQTTSASVAAALHMAVLTKNQTMFDKVLNNAASSLVRSKSGSGQTTYLDGWASAASVSGSTVTVTSWQIDVTAEVRIAKCLIRAWNLWGQNSYKTLASAKAGLIKSLSFLDESRAYVGTDETQKAVPFGHHTYNSSAYSKHSLATYDFVAFKLLYIFTGDAVFPALIEGGKDLWNKSTTNSGNLATTTGLPPRRLYYETAGHSVGAITSGSNGWTETQNTNYDLEAGAAIGHLRNFYNTYSDSWALSKLNGAMKTWFAAQGTIYAEYTHAGVNVGTNQLSVSYWRAIFSLTANDSGNSAAASIQTNKIPDTLGLDSNGRWIPAQIKGVTAVSGRDSDAGAWHALAINTGMDNDMAVLGSNPSTGSTSGSTVTTPPVVVPTTPTGPVVSGTFKLVPDTGKQANSYYNSLPAGQKKTNFAWFINVPTPRWVGQWDQNWAIAKSIIDYNTSQNALSTLLTYFSPLRDNGGYSAGGASSNAVYQQFITDGIAAIGNRYVAMVGEPDCIPLALGLGSEQRAARMANLAYSTARFAASCPNLFYYPDIGHPDWLDYKTAAALLLEAGADKVKRFAINVSNYVPFDRCVQYANQIRSVLGSDWHYTIDTGRSGNPQPAPGFANAPRRRFGPLPQWGGFDSIPGLDGVVWWKLPGESDGNSGDNAPNAGDFWSTYLWNDSLSGNGYNVDTGNVTSSSGMLQRPPTPGVPIVAPT